VNAKHEATNRQVVPEPGLAARDLECVPPKLVDMVFGKASVDAVFSDGIEVPQAEQLLHSVAQLGIYPGHPVLTGDTKWNQLFHSNPRLIEQHASVSRTRSTSDTSRLLGCGDPSAPIKTGIAVAVASISG